MVLMVIVRMTMKAKKLLLVDLLEKLGLDRIALFLLENSLELLEDANGKRGEHHLVSRVEQSKVLGAAPTLPPLGREELNPPPVAQLRDLVKIGAYG